MRKRLTLLLSVILFSALILATACESTDPPQSENGGASAENADKAKVSPSEITGAVIEGGTFPEMMERGLDELADYYYGIDLEGIADASCLTSPAGAFSDEVTVISVEADKSVLENLEGFFKAWIESEAEKWQSYNPEQARKLDNAIVEINGNYIAVFVCEDPQAALDIFNNFL